MCFNCRAVEATDFYSVSLMFSLPGLLLCVVCVATRHGRRPYAFHALGRGLSSDLGHDYGRPRHLFSPFAYLYPYLVSFLDLGHHLCVVGNPYHDVGPLCLRESRLVLACGGDLLRFHPSSIDVTDDVCVCVFDPSFLLCAVPLQLPSSSLRSGSPSWGRRHHDLASELRVLALPVASVASPPPHYSHLLTALVPLA
jgi:hypothetical protein